MKLRANLAYCFSSGAADYITKPFKKLILLSRVRNAINAKRDREQVKESNRELKVLLTPEEKVIERTLALEQEMILDRLTGLYNRFRLESKMHQRKVSFILINVNEFSAINNAYGIEAGNQILVEMAELLLGVVDSQESIFRIGGDEFVILVDIREQIKPLCEKLRSILTIKPYRYKNADLFIQVSLEWWRMSQKTSYRKRISLAGKQKVYLLVPSNFIKKTKVNKSVTKAILMGQERSWS